MKNNYLFNIIWVVPVLVFFCSCEDFLDRKPLNNLDEKQFWQNEQQAIQGVTAIYAVLQNSGVYGDYVLNDMYTPIADETEGGQINLGLHTADYGKFSTKWTSLYLGINRANIALKRIPSILMNESLKKRLLAEAKFLRALFYFNLIDFYGDVPLYVDEIEVTTANKLRTPVKEIQEQIISDLKEAIPDLEIVYSVSDIGRVTQGAAKALLGKVYLYAQEYDLAAEVLDELISNKAKYGYDLLANYADVFNYHNENNKEVIFDVQFVGPKLGEGSLLDYYLGNLSCNGTGGNNTSCPTVELLDSYCCVDGLPITESELYDPNNRYENRDKRLDMTIMRPGSYFKDLEYAYPLRPGYYVKGRTRTGLMWRKYVVEDEGSAHQDDPQNFIVIRYADVLLMYAEAANEILSNPDESIYSAINSVRERAGIKALEIGSCTKDRMRELIRQERKVEFACEGLYYSDIRRWKIAETELNGVSFKDLLGNVYVTRVFDGSKHYLWPIPQQELDMNKNLTQNPGY